AKNMLEKMLKSCEVPNFLDNTIDLLVADLLGEDVVKDQANPDDIIGRKFGAWQVTNTLASGGMGQVFLAERADGQFEKKVAIKIIKSGEFSQMSQQRFLEEMRILAQFEHPNIAHLLDGGTSDDGIAYFVMEWVQGLPISDYVVNNQLGLKARIGLVLQAIEAVEYAHQNLFIHGDIKPANILVNESGQVKLVDFGIARPMKNQQAMEYLPQYTPSYSSPEQAQGKALSTASDVFGLSAVLYELCTGTAPRNKESMATQAEFTEKLNTAIDTAHANYLVNKKHDQRPALFIDSKKCNHALSKELGSIIDKGLQIEVDNRYKNTTEMRSDLLLFLEGSAVPSFANNWLYRWQKSALKHKWTVGLSTLAMLSIISVAMVALHQARLAQQEAEKANWANQFLLSIFDRADPIKNQQQPITVNQLTAQAAAQILQDKNELPVKATSLEMLSQIQYKLGEVESAGRLVKEQIKLMQKLTFDDVELAAVYIKAGNVLEAQDNLDEAIQYYRQALQLAPITTYFNESSIRANIALANSLWRLNELDESQEIVNSLMSYEYRIENLDAANSLIAALYAANANLLLSKQQFDQVIEQLNIAKQRAMNVSGEPLLYPNILSIEADTYYESGQLKQAANIDRELVEYFSQNFGEDHPETIDKLGQLAVSLAALGDLHEAIEINQRVTANLKGTEIKGHQLPAAYLNMGTAYQVLGEDLKAIENYHKAQELWPQLEPRIVIYEASTDVRMAQSYLGLKQYENAKRYFDSALNQVEKEFGLDHALYARFQIMYAPLLLELDQIEEASAIIPSAYQKMVEIYGEQSKNAAVANLRRAQLNLRLGNHQLAVEQAKSVVQILDVQAYRKRNQALISSAQDIIQSI
ncbi:MAG: protein kinase domain-containing protein, partial [Marinicella sp.]